jgi:hypothetical protein
MYNSGSPNNNERKGDGVRNRAKNRLEGHLGYIVNRPQPHSEFVNFFLPLPLPPASNTQEKIENNI